MGIFSGIFDNKNSKELVSVVAKRENSSYGHFLNILNDLADYIEKVGQNETELRKMAYAYARRYASAGLYLQGIFDTAELAYQKKMFLGFQYTTGNSKQFQIEAHEQALNYVKSYDKRLSREFLAGLIIAAESGGVDSPKEQGIEYDFDAIVFTINHMREQGSIKVPNNIEEMQKSGIV